MDRSRIASIDFSLAGVWIPIAERWIPFGYFGTTIGFHGVVRVGAEGRAGVVLGGWGYSGQFGGTGVDGRSVPIDAGFFVEGPDGRLRQAHDLLGGTRTKGAGSVIVEDFNGDGRDDIVMIAHNESPFSPEPSTAWLSGRSDGFTRVVLDDRIMAHHASLTEIDGAPAIVTQTFQPGDARPVYAFRDGRFVTDGGALLAGAGGMSMALSTPEDGAERILVVGRTGGQAGETLVQGGVEIRSFEGGRVGAEMLDFPTYLSTLPEYADFESQWGRGRVHVSRVWTDDLNHDGRPDILVGNSMFTLALPGFPSALQIIQNLGEGRFEDRTEKLNPDIDLDQGELDYSMQFVDIDGSGIDSLLLAGESPGEDTPKGLRWNHDRQGNFLLLNDGTGRLHVALHEEFTTIARNLHAGLAAGELSAPSPWVIDSDPSRVQTPRFIGWTTRDGKVNYLAEVGAYREIPAPDPDTVMFKDGKVYYNVNLEYDPTTDFTRSIRIADRNDSRLIRTFAGDDLISDRSAAPGASIDGGLGRDTARYAGPAGDYVRAVRDSVATVEGVAGPALGAIDDTLRNVERLAFRDRVLVVQGDELAREAIGSAAADVVRSVGEAVWAKTWGGADRVVSGARPDWADLGDGEDLARVAGGADTVAGGGGADTLDGGAGPDRLSGGAGADRLLGGDGSDSLAGDAGVDRLLGGGGNDRLDGGAGRNLIDGGTGADTIVFAGATGGLRVNLGSAVAQATAPGARDRLVSIEHAVGSAHADSLSGNGSANLLQGEGGADTLSGGGRADTLVGGAGNDRLAGGAGADRFVIAPLLQQETIADFGVGADRIALVGFGAAFGDAASVLAAARQAGEDVAITLGPTRIMLEDFSRSALGPEYIVFL